LLIDHEKLTETSGQASTDQRGTAPTVLDLPCRLLDFGRTTSRSSCRWSSRGLIPYEIRSGVRFFEQAIKDVLAYLKIATNPRDELSWKRMLKLYPKVGEKTAAEVWARIGEDVNPLDAFLRGGVAPSPSTARAAGGGGGAAGGGGATRAIAGSLASARDVLRLISSESMQHNPSETIRMVVEKGYGDYARAKFPNAQARLDDLEQLSQYALRYEDVNQFLDEVALANPIAGEDVATVGPEDEKIVLSSVHQAKGLEWRIVFVIWLADGRFPSQRALRVPGGIIRIEPSRMHEALPLLEGATDDAAVIDEAGTREIVIPGEEEERRLFYVAVTRAMQELYLVFPVMARDRGGMDILMEPSRFVRELPGEIYEKWVIGTE
jgi:DNA helicase-2/ATP-dependent DNA helicase PcrA